MVETVENVCYSLLFPVGISVRRGFHVSTTARCHHGQVLVQSRLLALQMTVRRTGIYFYLKSASKLMQPTYNAVNRGISVRGHSDCGQIVIL